jgi:hypothetical protein
VANRVPSQLDLNRAYAFRFYVGVPRVEGSLVGAAPLDPALEALAAQQGVDVDVIVFCRFCQADQASQRQTLRIGPQGDTKQLTFPVTPTKAGADKLTVLVEHRRIVVETFNVPAHVGPGAVTAVPAPAPRPAADLAAFRGVPETEATLTLSRTSTDEFQVDLHVPGRGISVPKARSATVSRADKLALDVWLALRKLVKGIDIVSYTDQEVKSLDFGASKKQVLLLELARIGREMYRVLLLEDPQYRGLMRQIAGLVPAPARISIRADNLYLPWAILYDGDPDDLERGIARPEGFWGYRYRIQGYLYDTPTRTVPGSQTGYPLGVLFGHYTPVPSSTSPLDREYVGHRQQQEAFFKKYVPHVDLALLGSETAFTQALRRSAPLDVVYVYAHGKGGQQAALGVEVATGRQVPIYVPNPGNAAIMLTSGGSGIRPDDLHRLATDHDVRLAGEPIVFLNVCEGEAVAAVSSDTFVRTFLMLGARAIITSDAEVWQGFGRDFATRLFQRFLDTAYTGDASQMLWELRREYLDQKGNPFGFLYTLWGYAGNRPRRP